MRRRDVLASGLSSLSLPLVGASLGRTRKAIPMDPIKLIVPRAAGGVVDVVARFWAEQVKSQLGNVVIENQGGGGGIIAAPAVARAKPDGHTLLAGTTTELVISPVIMSTPAYDPVKDLAPIAITAVSVSALMVHESLPVKTLTELVAYAKANPGKLSYGSAGVGTSAHLCAELFKQLAGLPDIVHVPYKGANPGPRRFLRRPSADVRRQHLAAGARNAPPGQDPHSGRRQPRRLEGAPDIPISAEVGFPDLITLMFMGVFAPGGTPRPIIDQIAAATRR